MTHNNNIKYDVLIEHTKKLGINEKELKQILQNNPAREMEISFSMGPKPYWATYYGTVSIKDF